MMRLLSDNAKWFYVPAALSLIALLPLPYGYYTAVRPVIFIGAALVLWSLYQPSRQITGLAWAFLVIALLFNPFVPVHLSKALWMPIDLVSAVLFALIAMVEPFKNMRSRDDEYSTIGPAMDDGEVRTDNIKKQPSDYDSFYKIYLAELKRLAGKGPDEHHPAELMEEIGQATGDSGTQEAFELGIDPITHAAMIHKMMVVHHPELAKGRPAE